MTRKINQFRNAPPAMRKRRRHRAWVMDIHVFLRNLAREMFG